MMRLPSWLRRNRDRVDRSRRALARQERLTPVVTMQGDDARQLGEWARDRLRRNHLSQLFLDHHAGGGPSR